MAIKDLEHIKKYASFIDTSNINVNDKIKHPNVNVAIQDVDLFGNIVNLLKVTNSNKTINPNDFYNLNINDEQMFCLIIGFIDGDGCIKNQTNRDDCSLRIHIHKNWFDNLLFMENFIYHYFNEKKEKNFTTIGNDGYSRLIISNNILLKKLKTEVLRLNLPILKRKRDIINENKISKKEDISIIKEEIKQKFLNGISAVELINVHGYKHGIVYKEIKGLK